MKKLGNSIIIIINILVIVFLISYGSYLKTLKDNKKIIKDINLLTKHEEIKKTFLSELNIIPGLYDYIDINEEFNDFLVNLGNGEYNYINRSKLEEKIMIGVKKYEEEFDQKLIINLKPTTKVENNLINQFKRVNFKIKVNYNNLLIGSILILLINLIFLVLINKKVIGVWYHVLSQLISLIIIIILMTVLKFINFSGNVLAIYLNKFKFIMFDNYKSNVIYLFIELGILLLINLIIYMLLKKKIKREKIVTEDNFLDDYNK